MRSSLTTSHWSLPGWPDQDDQGLQSIAARFYELVSKTVMLQEDVEFSFHEYG